MKIKLTAFLVIGLLVALFAIAYVALGQTDGEGNNGQQWEYLYFGYFADNEGELVATSDTALNEEIGCVNFCASGYGAAFYLNIAGLHGWELVTGESTFSEGGSSFVGYLKRPTTQ